MMKSVNLETIFKSGKNNRSEDMWINYLNWKESRDIGWRKWTEQKDYEKKDYSYCLKIFLNEDICKEAVYDL
jgi:hypothetical protein